MDKKILLTILLNQCTVMHIMSDLIYTYISGRDIDVHTGKYLDCAETLIKRSKETEELLEKIL